LLGRNALEIFFRIVLPISRGAIIGGVSLVSLEVLNDYGVVQYFGVPTFSTAIFQTWFGMGDLQAAIKLSATLMFLLLSLLIVEELLRWRERYSDTIAKARALSPLKLTGWEGWAGFGYILFIFGIGFLMPFIQLVDWTFLSYKRIADPQFISLFVN